MNSNADQLNRLCWLTENGFILKPNYEWHHIAEKVMIKHTLVTESSISEWDRLIDAIEYQFDNS